MENGDCEKAAMAPEADSRVEEEEEGSALEGGGRRVAVMLGGLGGEEA